MKILKQNHLSLVALPLAALLLTNCSKAVKDEATANGDVKNAIPDVGAIIIDMPSAIAPASGNLRLADNGGLERIFMTPVQFTGVAGQMTALTKGVIEHIFGKPVCTDTDTSNDVDDCDEYRGIIVGEINETPTVFAVPGAGEDEESPSHVKYWANPAGADYDMGLEIYWANADGKFVPAMQMQLSKTGDKQGKGEFTFFPAAVGSDGPDTIVTSFVATEDKKSMDMRVYLPEELGISGLGLSVAETGGVITGAGTAIRPEQDADEGPLAPIQKKAEYAFVFTLAADDTNNIAVEKLATVPLAAYADEDSYFTSYGVDGLLKTFVVSFLRSPDTENFNCALHGGAFGLPDNICKSNTAVTDTQVYDGFTSFCSTRSTEGLCAITSQSGSWANPIYLNANGYVGNESHNKPTDSNYAPLVEALTAITVYTPTAFKALEKPKAPTPVDTVE